MQFPLSIYIVEGTGWSDQEVKGHIEVLQKIFAQCQLRAAPLEIQKLQLKEEWHEFSAPKDQEIASHLNLQMDRATLFFMGGRDTAQAYGDEFAEGSPRNILKWTGWISRLIESPAYKARLPVGYNPVAHELGHILCNCGHVEGQRQNLMSGEPKNLGSQLTQQQCAEMRRSTLIP